MIILSIETSCDETAVCIVEASGGLESPTFTVLGNALFSQVELHKEFGGVFPTLAKREHARNLIPLLEKVLKESNLISNFQFPISKQNFENKEEEISKILEKEKGLFESFKNFLENKDKPEIDLISVTSGPGLEPALWVGIVFAQALGKLWNIPVLGINHMEGHIASVLIDRSDEFKILNLKFKNNAINFPALAVLISGGHTEIVKMKSWDKYEVIGETVDDAVGEAFDKTARMMGLPYPGGPEVSHLAGLARVQNLPHKAKLPRPMIHSKNLNFSFSGLKTAVLYYIRDNFQGEHQKMTENDKADLAREFEESILDVLKEKTEEALNLTHAKTLIVAGGVIASQKIQEVFKEFEGIYPDLKVKFPTKLLATDNALMIAAATYIKTVRSPEVLSNPQAIVAKGNLRYKNVV